MSEINGSGPQKDHFTKRQTLLVAASTVTAAVLGVGCVFAVQDAFGAHVSTSAQQYTSQPALGQSGGGSSYGGGYSGYGGYSGSGTSGGATGGQSSQGQSGDGDPFGGNAFGGSSGSGSASGSSSGSTAAATSAQSRGIVLIDTELGYQSAEAAGTGIVLTSSGEILTNNHVIEGSTSIKVIDAGTTYTAKVVGDDATDDIAVLQLQGAKGLTTASLDTSHTVSTGDAVTGVGNAEGGGTLVAAAGQVTGLDKSITTEAEESAASESLHGLIETDAAIEPGDSGGPLFDASNKIVGIDTAASSGGAADGYAIPIATALGIAKQITSGDAGGNIALGYPAFLGIELGETDASGSSGSSGQGAFGGQSGFGDQGTTQGSDTTGAQIAGVVDNGPAEEAGLTAGDVITALDGTAISSADVLQSALKSYAPGDTVSLTWTDASGQSHTASVTLTEGPAA